MKRLFTSPIRRERMILTRTPHPLLLLRRAGSTFRLERLAALPGYVNGGADLEKHGTEDRSQGRPRLSPVIYKDLFILDCDGTDFQFIAALDKNTGKLVWKTKRSFDLASLQWDLRKAYCTPTVVSIDGRDQLVDVGAQRAYGYDPTDGRELWHVDLPGFSDAPRPVIHDGIAYISTGFMKAELWACGWITRA